MISISLCMIVKNEENVFNRCLASIYDLVDEIVIVDTGSTDSTKEIAKKYTDKIYDFEWIDDFSAARNFSFSKCTKDYIYVADADEYLDENNRIQFRLLKENMITEIEIVQMMYETISHNTVLNINREYRPKLFKRLRQFIWINPVHEVVRLDPLVFDSDIVVTHAPEANHAKRDFSIFEKTILEQGGLSENLTKMYATELYKNGIKDDIAKAYNFFISILDVSDTFDFSGKTDFFIEEVYSIIIIAKHLRLTNDNRFEAFVLNIADKVEWPSELCFELGEYYLSIKKYDKAYDSFKMAYNSQCYLDIHSGGDVALKRIILCIEELLSQYSEYASINGNDSKMESLIVEYRRILDKYKIELDNWITPEQDTE